MRFFASARGMPSRCEGRTREVAAADSVVDHLRLVALFLGDFRQGQAEDAGRRGAMDVLAAGERLKQAGVLRQRGEDAQFDLRVVGGEDPVVALARDESAANLATLRGADRDILQVRDPCRLRRPVVVASW